MMEAYIGQIEIFAFNFAPQNWALCAGQLLAISQNQALFSLLGTTYGGDGIRTFGLPNLLGRAVVGQGNGAGLTPRVIGETGGEENHTLLVTETPAHVHSLNATAQAALANDTATPGNTVVLAATSGSDRSGAPVPVPIYVADSAPAQALGAAACGMTGGQAHSNLMPYSTLNYCISLSGYYPTRN